MLHSNLEYLWKSCDGNTLTLENFMLEYCDICGKKIALCKCLEDDEKEEDEDDS